MYSPVVKVYRRCEANGRWISVDFSGCVLSSSEQQVLVIISLQTLITTDSSDELETARLENMVCVCVCIIANWPQRYSKCIIKLLIIMIAVENEN